MFYFRGGRNDSNVVDCLNLNLYSPRKLFTLIALTVNFSSLTTHL